jgi:hypothetical protein
MLEHHRVLLDILMKILNRILQVLMYIQDKLIIYFVWTNKIS